MQLYACADKRLKNMQYPSRILRMHAGSLLQWQFAALSLWIMVHAACCNVSGGGLHSMLFSQDFKRLCLPYQHWNKEPAKKLVRQEGKKKKKVKGWHQTWIFCICSQSASPHYATREALQKIPPFSHYLRIFTIQS